jgi:D-sedoheptulose 7-phosphate isomerase
MCCYFKELYNNYPELRRISGQIESAFNEIKNSLESGGTLFVCGNGGSASDAEHIVGELMKNFLIDRKLDKSVRKKFAEMYGEEESGYILSRLQPGIRAYSLSSHPGFISAYLNDVDPDFIFAQQLFVMGREGDILLGISTSGNSENIYRAFQTADCIGIKTVLLTGKNGGKCAQICNIPVKIDEVETFRIQEYHLPVYHALCASLEEYFYGK